MPAFLDADTHTAAQSIFFWIFAAIAVGGSILTITRRNLVTAVMFLVATFLSVAVLFALRLAHFLSVIQVLVYAGAIMVLFVFVVMILNKEEEEPWSFRNGVIGKIIPIAALGYLVVRMIMVLWTAKSSLLPGKVPSDYGTTMTLGKVLFSSYLFPFEAVSIVLLIAVVGALVLAHPSSPNAPQEGPE